MIGVVVEVEEAKLKFTGARYYMHRNLKIQDDSLSTYPVELWHHEVSFSFTLKRPILRLILYNGRVFLFSAIRIYYYFIIISLTSDAAQFYIPG